MVLDWNDHRGDLVQGFVCLDPSLESLVGLIPCPEGLPDETACCREWIGRLVEGRPLVAA